MILGFGIVANVITLDASKLSKQGKFRDSELAIEDLMQKKKNVTCQQFRHFLIELFVPKISFLFVACQKFGSLVSAGNLFLWSPCSWSASISGIL
jgi:hypothetical protein